MSPLKRTLTVFKTPKPNKTKVKQAKTVAMLKDNVSLFSRLYIVAQSRECDMVAFFQHENQPFPPIAIYKKYNLLTLLPHKEDSNPYDVNILDGTAVHFLSTVSIAKFSEYAACVFLPHITKLLNNASRVDIVWDTYIPTNIKADTREKRGKGVRRNVAGKETSYQAIGKVFLREEANKE